MKIAGIIAEYNPFHNGHAYHIEHTKAEKEGGATHVVAVMSGWFTQRGEPAVVSPFARADVALRNGVDLVIALPLPWAMSSAQYFAEGGVYLLGALNCVDLLSFGSECGDMEALCFVRRLLDDPRTAGRLKELMATGASYAAAMQQAVAESGGEKRAKLLDTPNNTLGIEYLGALTRQNSSIKPYTVGRMGVEHDAVCPIGSMASASYIRELLRSGRTRNVGTFVPNTVCDMLVRAAENGTCPSREELAERAVLAVLRTRSKDQLSRLPSVSEGIENRLYNAIRDAGSLEDLLDTAKTKRYTRTRLQRLIYSAFLGVTDELASGMPPYIRVLGANARGHEILRTAKQNGVTLPIITRASDAANLDDHAKRVFALECRAADLYSLFLPTPTPCGTEMTSGMVSLV